MVQRRIIRLMENLPPNIDGVIITSNVNRRYFLDFASSAGTLFVTKEKAYFIIDFRYIEVAKEKIKGIEVILEEKISDQIAELVKKHNLKKIVLENKYTTISQMKDFEKYVSPAEIVLDDEVNDSIINYRKYKDKSEIKRIIEAQRLTDETFYYALGIIKPGKTEKEIALEMEFFARKNGADAVSFDFIVLSGSNSSMPHGVPGNNVIKKGEFLLMDFGAEVDGYRSDMTRTVAIGSASEKMESIYNIVLKSQLLALEGIKPGIKTGDVDGIARDYIYSKGYEGKFGHGLGHSVGIEIHEAPRFAIGQEDITKEGIVMTVEPGIYLPSEFGVRIEDMGVVTKDGFDNFTKSKKELIIL